jgi:hypothetical protein
VEKQIAITNTPQTRALNAGMAGRNPGNAEREGESYGTKKIEKNLKITQIMEKEKASELREKRSNLLIFSVDNGSEI